MAALLDVMATEPSSLLEYLKSDVQPTIAVAGYDRFPPMDPEEVHLFHEAARLLGGVTKHRDSYIEGHLELDQDQALAIGQAYKVHQVEAWNRYLANCDGRIRSLADLVAWHQANPVGETMACDVPLTSI